MATTTDQVPSSAAGPMPRQRWLIGRSTDCDYVISHAQVSPWHADLEERRLGEYYLIDHESESGIFLNSPTNRIEETRVVSDDLLYFSPAFSITLGEILRALSSGTTRLEGQAGQMVQIDRPIISIGREPSNDVIIDNLLVNLSHARIEQLPDNKILIQDLGSTHGTLVNGELIRGRSRIITVNDRIEIAGQTLSLQISPDSGSARVGVQRQGIFVACRGADFQIKQRNGKDRHLLRAISFAVFPGEFVGLMGPSGSGKTTLLHLLLGTYRATGGAIEYNGIKAEVFKERFGSLIGYVPQEDMLHPELTVRETLYYQAKLRLPQDVSRQEIHNRIDRICFQLGLFRSGGIDVRDVFVGSPESKGLSGGQRKRLNLAIELLTEPKLLYLDEPTSGLSSRDTRIVMELLRKLASERNITVIITIHQPSQNVYRLLDKVIYLKNGRLGFFGPAFPDSVAYFIPG
jgi:ABC-type multidrug transport system ATPase subunit